MIHAGQMILENFGPQLSPSSCFSNMMIQRWIIRIIGGLAQPASEVVVLVAESVDPFAGQSGKLEESIATWWSRWQVWPWLWVWLPGDLDILDILAPWAPCNIF